MLRFWIGFTLFIGVPAVLIWAWYEPKPFPGLHLYLAVRKPAIAFWWRRLGFMAQGFLGVGLLYLLLVDAVRPGEEPLSRDTRLIFLGLSLAMIAAATGMFFQKSWGYLIQAAIALFITYAMVESALTRRPKDVFMTCLMIWWVGSVGLNLLWKAWTLSRFGKGREESPSSTKLTAS